MYNEDIRLAIDVGSSKICSVVIRRDNYQEPEILAINMLPNETMHDGNVMNRSEVTDAVRSSVNEVSNQCSLSFTKAYVGFGGKHVDSYFGWGQVSNFDFAAGVTEEDIVQAVRIAANERVEATDHLLYAAPTAYRVDGETEFRKPPVGMHPDTLEVEALLVVSDMEHYRAVFNAVDSAGVTPIHGGSTLVAEAEYLMSAYERDAGGVLIDIGGSDSEIAVYVHDCAAVLNSLPIGGSHFTSDIAYAYELPFENAEAVKLAAGTLVGDSVGLDDEIDPTLLSGSERVIDVERSLTRVSVSNLLKERAAETMSLYKSRLSQIPGLPDTDFLTVVFTGGGAKLNGITTFAKMSMGLRGRVEVRKPTGIKSLPDDVSDPAMSGAICMARRALDRIERDNHVERKPVTILHSTATESEEPASVSAKIRALFGR